MKHPTLESLSSDFSTNIRTRGLTYYRKGVVRLAEVSPARVLAIVQGTHRYTVEILFKGTRITMSCSCPFFYDWDKPCKHLWAVLLKLDERGYISNRETALASEPAPPSAVQQLLPIPEWEVYIREIRQYQAEETNSRRATWPAERQILYVLDVPRTLSDGRAVVHLLYRDRSKPADLRPLWSSGSRLDDLWKIPDPEDREILAVLRGVSYEEEFDDETYRYRLLGKPTELLCPTHRLDEDLVKFLLPKMCGTGRLFLKTRRDKDFDPTPISWDDAEPWEFKLEIAETRKERSFRLEGSLRRADERMPLSEVDLLLKGGLMFGRRRLARYMEPGSFGWIVVLRRVGHLSVGREDLPSLLDELLSMREINPLEIAESLSIETLEAEPQPRLKVIKADPEHHSRTGGGLVGQLSFEYQDHIVDGLQPTLGFFSKEDNLLVLRRPEKEKEALDRLLALGFRLVDEYRSQSKVLKLTVRQLPAVVEQLVKEDWSVEAEGKLLRRAGRFDIQVVSGIDWFELRGKMSFGDTEVPLPELLKALRRGGNTVRLGDGSFGILPEQWLKQQGLFLKMGEVREDHLRFHLSQALLIDLFLQAQPQASCDELYKRVRDKLKDFTGIGALDAPPGFVGELRGYQREGLGWFRFLDEFGFGGCLADDMGLGKTVQVLALLESLRKKQRARRASSLVVVPRSLVFNWKAEASRFTPGLKVLEHTGPGRPKGSQSFAAWDVVLTTYGTMRNDIALLKDYLFDYIILDEVQVIKNFSSQSAKAARLLQGHRRLALSGTPIENHLGDLWSLFEFLNPGMLGGVSFFKRHFKSRESADESFCTLLARYLRPFILRRTKEQVAPELPDKVEQTLFCELQPGERRRYDELKKYYRLSLQRSIDTVGLGKTKIHVLEALLRLRQASCHPGLLDHERIGGSSAKIDLLLQHLDDVLAEDHKALVFSQFTSLLSILRDRLDRQGVLYEYLDGQTRDRARRIERFQQDPECKLFLISLKAGGLGLNLTAAEYVFLLDPWWNPATEAQAIDRTHRIGQEKKVFAYRLVAKDTVEEKVLELQKSKRKLAEAIIGEDNRLIGKLSRKDLALLLS